MLLSIYGDQLRRHLSSNISSTLRDPSDATNASRKNLTSMPFSNSPHQGPHTSLALSSRKIPSRQYPPATCHAVTRSAVLERKNPKIAKVYHPIRRERLMGWTPLAYCGLPSTARLVLDHTRAPYGIWTRRVCGIGVSEQVSVEVVNVEELINHYPRNGAVQWYRMSSSHVQ